MGEDDTDSEGPPHRLDPDQAAQERTGHTSGGDRTAGEGPPHRLDPDRAAEAAARRGPRRPPPPVIDTRRYQRMIGLVGLTLVVVISVAFLTSHGVGMPGLSAGNHVRFFAAPLANTNLNGDADLNPPCTLARHDPRALNICLIAKHRPLVLAFFVTGSGGCEAQVSALQLLSSQFSPSRVQFAAVAVRTNHHDAAAAVRSHHWTIPVAYDADGAVADAYGVAVCPITELVNRGGVVEQRLIGEHWNDPQVLAGQIRTLLRRSQTS